MRVEDFNSLFNNMRCCKVDQVATSSNATSSDATTSSADVTTNPQPSTLSQNVQTFFRTYQKYKNQKHFFIAVTRKIAGLWQIYSTAPVYARYNELTQYGVNPNDDDHKQAINEVAQQNYVCPPLTQNASEKQRYADCIREAYTVLYWWKNLPSSSPLKTCARTILLLKFGIDTSIDSHVVAIEKSRANFL